MCGNEEWEQEFEMNNRELFRTLQDKYENKRLWAIAKLEEKCYSCGVPMIYIDSLVNIIENDESPIIRAMAIRALYHEPSESWPNQPPSRVKVSMIIDSKVRGRGVDGIDQHIAFEVHEIDKKMKWLQR